MADAAVEALLGNIQQLLSYHANLIIGIHDEVKQLEIDLSLFKAFLDSTSKNRIINDDDGLKELVRQIRDVVLDAEDVIDSFVTQVADIKSKNYFVRAFKKKPMSIHDIVRRVRSVSEQVNQVCREGSDLDSTLETVTCTQNQEKQDDANILRSCWSMKYVKKIRYFWEIPLRRVNVVGFEDETEILSRYLTQTTEQLEVISIIGMPGIGKTTLAAKIYHDPSIQYEFPVRIWVYVSQDFTARDVFLAILKELITSLPEDMYHKTDFELAKVVSDQLDRGKFLIVMDDVWTTRDWDKLKIALPMNNNMGKVLITSRNEKVGRHANRNRPPHNLRYFTHAESWLLLQLEIFGKPECPSELEVIGEQIAKQCDGLPLAIVVIGGILERKKLPMEDLSAMISAFTEVLNYVKAYHKEWLMRSMEKIIALSYDKLPTHLKACFLYLGMFPEDFEIPVWKLIYMWISEGFIQRKEGTSLEETAERYLEDLIDRNLLRIDKMRRNGQIKTCRIHDMIRDFCKNEAGNERENFLMELKASKDGIFISSFAQVVNSRRLCLHSNVLSFVTLKPFGPSVRSFVYFSNEETVLPTEHMSSIMEAFKLLRVLDVKPIKFTRIPSDMYQMLHLRFINLSLELNSLPRAFTNLWNIQTLIINTKSPTLDIKADIWKMVHFRHLVTKASATLPQPTNSSKEGPKFQTLGVISPQSCTKGVFVRMSNLKNLGIRGKLSVLLDGNSVVSFDGLKNLGNLEKLKLLNDVFPDPAFGNKLGRLPPAGIFPPKLKILTISNTYLDWSQMSILGLLANLEVLKLKDNAFVGESWETDSGGFGNLQVLVIGYTNLAIWKASADHFPRLRQLELKNCEQLQVIPIELADIPTLQLVDLFRSNSAASSAKKIVAKLSGIKLSIFPTPNE